MASVPRDTMDAFTEKYPTVPVALITEAARRSGERINGGIDQVRGLVSDEILGNNGAFGEEKVREYFGDHAQGLIDGYYLGK